MKTKFALFLVFIRLVALSSFGADPVPGLVVGRTLILPLDGKSGAAQARLLEELKKLPKQIASEARSFKTDGGALQYRLFCSAKVDAGKKLPLVVYLHGGGARRQFEDVISGGAPGFTYGIGRLVAPETQAKYPSFVVAPWSDGGGWDGKKASQISALIDALCKEFPIDARRIYLTGQSMGGAGTWNILAAYPQKFAAAIPICGFGQPGDAAKMKETPLWVIHGNKDTVMPLAGSSEMVKALLAAGGKPIYWEYEGATHAQTAERAYCEPALMDWLFAQARH